VRKKRKSKEFEKRGETSRRKTLTKDSKMSTRKRELKKEAAGECGVEQGVCKKRGSLQEILLVVKGKGTKETQEFAPSRKMKNEETAKVAGVGGGEKKTKGWKIDASESVQPNQLSEGKHCLLAGVVVLGGGGDDKIDTHCRTRGLPCEERGVFHKKKKTSVGKGGHHCGKKGLDKKGSRGSKKKKKIEQEASPKGPRR